MIQKQEITDILNEIDGDSIVGFNAKYDEDYMALDDEIKKLTSAYDRNSVSYEKIINLSKDILINKSKDIIVLCYLSSALLNTKYKEDALVSLDLLNKFIQKYWQEAFPPIEKTKARTGILRWFIDRLIKVLESDKKLDLNESDYRSFIQNINFLEEFFRNNLDEVSININLIDELLKTKHLKLVSEVKKVEEVQIILEQDSSEISETQKEDNINSIMQDFAPLPEQKQDIETIRRQSNRGDDSFLVDSKNNESTNMDFNSLKVEDLYEKYIFFLKETKNILNILFEKGLYSNELFLINRLYLWHDVNTIPINEKGITLLSAPKEHNVNYLQNLYKEQNWLELLRKSESLIDEYVFWFDLHYYIAQSLINLNKKTEAAVVKFSVNNFLEKILGIEKLMFSDKKTPFASQKTLTWLNKKDMDFELLNLDNKNILQVSNLKSDNFGWLSKQFNQNLSYLGVNM